MRKKVMIVGPYGAKNLGDDLILHQILEEISEYDLDITVSCSSPEIVSEIFGVPTYSLLECHPKNLSISTQQKAACEISKL